MASNSSGDNVEQSEGETMTAMASVFGEAMLRACLLAVLVALGLRLLRVRHARVQKRAWVAVLVVALAMPALVFWRVPSVAVAAPALGMGHVAAAARLAWARVRGSVPAATLAQPAAAAGRLTLLPSLPPVGPAGAGQTGTSARAARSQSGAAWASGSGEVASVQVGGQKTDSPLRRSQVPRLLGYGWPSLVLALYLLIAAVLVARIAVGLLLAMRMWRHATPFITDRTKLPVRWTSEIAAPVTLGSGILLPEEAAGWDSRTLLGVLAHEAAHVHEWDFYLQLLASLHVALFWVSPLAWWLRPQLARLSEIVCDRAALESNMDGWSYAQLLLHLSGAQKTPASMVAMARSAGLRERVERLLADPQLASHFQHRRAHALVALVVVGGSAWGTAATVRVVQPAERRTQSAVNASRAPVTAPVVPPVAVPASITVAAPDSLDAVQGPEAAHAESRDSAQSQGMALANSGAASHTAGESAPSLVSLPTPVLLALPATAGPTVSLAQSASTEGNPRTYAIFGPDGDNGMTMCGWYRDGDLIQKQHARHPGAAIWFEKDGKAWVIDDPAVIREAQQAYAPVQALGRQQNELGKKQGALGEKQGQLGDLQGKFGDKLRLLGKKQGDLGLQHLNVSLPPGFDKTLQQLVDVQVHLALNQPPLSAADRARLEAQQKEAEAKLQAALAQIQAQTTSLEAVAKEVSGQRVPMEQAMRAISEQMQELGRQQGEMGAQQGALGRQQGEFSQQQHAASEAANTEVQALIDRALRDGKAHPVE